MELIKIEVNKMEQEESFKAENFALFLKYLDIACRNIKDMYYHIPIASSTNTIYRERVYTYELYHQLRNILGLNFYYDINGELLKSRFTLMQTETTPDLLIHKSNERNNLVVIEVKSTEINKSSRYSEVRNDVNKINHFLNLDERDIYYRGILLIYGDEMLENRPLEIINGLQRQEILFLRHSKVKNGIKKLVWERKRNGTFKEK